MLSIMITKVINWATVIRDFGDKSIIMIITAIKLVKAAGVSGETQTTMKLVLLPTIITALIIVIPPTRLATTPVKIRHG